MELTDKIGLEVQPSEAELHLREALKHVAVAEALIAVDGIDDSTLAGLTQEILRRTIQIYQGDDITSHSNNSNGSAAPKSPAGLTQINGSGDFVPAEAATAANGNGHTPDVVISELPFSGSGETEIVSSQGITTDSRDLSHDDEQEQRLLPETEIDTQTEHILITPSLGPSSGETKKTFTITGNQEISVDGKTIVLSPTQIAGLNVLLSHRNKAISGSDIKRVHKVMHFPDYMKSTMKKMHDAGVEVEDLLFKEGDRKTTTWQLNPAYDFIDSRPSAADRSDTQAIQGSNTEPREAVVQVAVQELGSNALSRDIDIQEVEELKVLSVQYEGSLADRRTRRNTFLEITNIDELNSWMSAQNPYGKLPKVEIKNERQIVVAGVTYGVSDDQREFLNIMLANMGKPLTQAQIYDKGFADMHSNKEQLRTFSGTASRFMQLRLDDENRLLLGDKLNAHGFMLNPVFELVDDRQDVKKKI